MKRSLIVASLALALLSAGAQAKPYKSAPGPYTVEVKLGQWQDAARSGRVVPWKLYWPRENLGKVPIVIWSHGAGGSRDGAEYLGRHLASHGYAAFHIQHEGSDVAVLRSHGVQGMLREVQKPEASIARFGDVGFALSQIQAMAKGQLLDGFSGRLDTAKIGISGHSFGALTTLVAAGQSGREVGQRFARPEFKGAFAMSPATPRSGDPKAAFAKMLMPIFHLTGTNDASPLGDQSVETRSLPFETITGVDQWLLVLEDGIHMTFSGRKITEAGPARDKLERHHELVSMAAVAFWDMLLRDDAAATAWLRQGGFNAELKPADGTLRFKPSNAKR